MEGSPHRTPKVYTSPATPPAQPILAASPTSSPFRNIKPKTRQAVSYTHLRAHETR